MLCSFSKFFFFRCLSENDEFAIYLGVVCSISKLYYFWFCKLIHRLQNFLFQINMSRHIWTKQWTRVTLIQNNFYYTKVKFNWNHVNYIWVSWTCQLQSTVYDCCLRTVTCTQAKYFDFNMILYIRCWVRAQENSENSINSKFHLPIGMKIQERVSGHKMIKTVFNHLIKFHSLWCWSGRERER